MRNLAISTKLFVIPVLGSSLLSGALLAPSRSLAIGSPRRSIYGAPGTHNKIAADEELSTDDGSVETGALQAGLIVVNRLTPSSYPATLKSIRIFFVQFQGYPSPSGSPIRLFGFPGAAGSTQPTDNPIQSVDEVVSIPSVPAEGGFIDFPIKNRPTITAGDFYVGFQAPNPVAGVVFAADANGPQQQRGFFSTDDGGHFRGPLVLANGQQQTPVNIMIRGVFDLGVPQSPSVSYQPTALDFGIVAPGSTTEQVITVRSIGSVPLSITGVPLTNTQFSLPPLTLPLTIAPNSQASFIVRFSPTASGTQAGTLTINSNDPASPSVSVSLNGVGGQPSGDTKALTSGTPLNGTIAAPPSGGAIRDTTQYSIVVPGGANQLKIDLSGSQDVDLYVRFGQRVTNFGLRTIAEYISETDNNTESVTITPTSSPALLAGTYFISVANFGPGLATYTVTATVNYAEVNTSAASFTGAEVASEMIVAGFGTVLSTTIEVAATNPPPTSLGGTTVKVKDSLGTERLAPIFFVSPAQSNFGIPAGTANGAAEITVTNGNGSVSTGTVMIATVAPGLFAANSNGQGVAAAVALRVKADGTQSFEQIARFDATQGKFVSVPIDLGPESDQVFLVLFGTGIRFRSGLPGVVARIGGVDSQVTFAGAAPGFFDLDQVNVRLSRSLIGKGETDVALTVDGKSANTVRVNVK